MNTKRVYIDSFKLFSMVCITISATSPAASDASPFTTTQKQRIESAELQNGSQGGALYAGPLIESTGFETTDGWVARGSVNADLTVNNGFICGPEFADCSDPDPFACPG